MDLVVEKADALRRAADKAGIKLSETKRAFLVQGNDRVGAVADTLGKLADANVNVTSAAASSAGSSYSMVLWVAPGDYDKAAKALGV
jgi:predicted amino acid-binding ACT domain protein